MVIYKILHYVVQFTILFKHIKDFFFAKSSILFFYDDRLTMNYIGRMIKRHQREFRFWLRVYHGFSLALLPKYAALITLAVVFDGGAPFRIALCIAAGLGIAFLILVRMQFDSSHVSKYAQR